MLWKKRTPETELHSWKLTASELGPCSWKEEVRSRSCVTFTTPQLWSKSVPSMGFKIVSLYVFACRKLRAMQSVRSILKLVSFYAPEIYCCVESTSCNIRKNQPGHPNATTSSSFPVVGRPGVGLYLSPSKTPKTSKKNAFVIIWKKDKLATN